ncbi:MAG: hypothetical protein FWD49_01820 [Firmicutes bacterium]|nr:hypothetical protein [Bacillota bacterium]
MTTDTKFLQKKFSGLLSELYETRLILSGSRISRLLSFISSEPDLLALITEAVRAIDHKAELERALRRDGHKVVFKLPDGQMEIISLVTGLMYRFDSEYESISIVDFITKLFPAPSGNSHESYANFCNEVLKPYERAVLGALSNNLDGVENSEAEEISADALPDNAKTDLDFWLRNLLELVKDDKSLNTETAKDYSTLLRGMLHAGEEQNNSLLKTIFTGLKYALKPYKKAQRELEEIQNLLVGYKIL